MVDEPSPTPATPPARSTPLVTLGLVAAVFHLLFQWSFPALAEFDAYYHVGLADLYRHHGLVRTFPWMWISILKDHFNDPQLLLHLITLPVLAVGVPPMIAGKLVAAGMATLLVLTFYWFLLRAQTRFAVVWSLLIFMVCSPYLLARLTFIKSTALFLSLLLFFLEALQERRLLRLFVLSWLAVYTYQGFPLLMVVALMQLGATAVVDGPERVRFEVLRPIVAGMAAGLVLNPFFPNDLRFFHFEIVQQILLKPKELTIGAEWSPVDTSRFLATTFLALALLFFADAMGALTRAGSDARLLVVRTLALLLLFGGLLSSRLIEYFVPFAMLAAALGVSRALDHMEKVRFNLRVLWGIVLFLCVPVAAYNLKEGLRIARSIADGIHTDEYRQIAEWLTQHSDEDEVVATQWDDFPMMFFFDRKNRYLYGLNTMYGYGYDPQLYTAVSYLYEARIRDPEELLRKLPSRFLLVSRADSIPARQQLVAQLKVNKSFTEVAVAGSSHLFRLDAPAAPAPAPGGK